MTVETQTLLAMLEKATEKADSRMDTGSWLYRVNTARDEIVKALPSLLEENARLRSALIAADNWLADEDTSNMGRAEKAVLSNLQAKITLALKEPD